MSRSCCRCGTREFNSQGTVGHLGFKVFSEVFGESYTSAGLGRYVPLPD